VQEDPIADAYCTAPAFRWKNMFYPEIKMPYMPDSVQKTDLADGINMAAAELGEVELAMVCFSSLPNVSYSIFASHACPHSLSRWRRRRPRKEP
jgi:hypothetical protein